MVLLLGKRLEWAARELDANGRTGERAKIGDSLGPPRWKASRSWNSSGDLRLGRRIRTIHTHMLAGQVRIDRQCCVNAIRLAIEIGIVRDGDDSGMVRRTSMQRDEVPAIASQDGSAQARRKGQLIRVRDALIRLPCLECRQDIMPKLAQAFYHRKGNILVRVKQGHNA